MADELIEICDAAGNLTGEQKMKSEAHLDGSWHRAAHVWLYNFRGELLLQLRAAEKTLYPSVWDVSAAGHVGVGEKPIIAALRELEEELGLQVAPEDLEFFKVVKNSPPFSGFKNNEFYHVYFCEYAGSLDELILQPEEVDQVKYFTISEIERQLEHDQENFVPHGSYWYEILAEFKTR